VSGFLNYRFQGYYLLPFGYTLEATAISYLLLYFVRSPDSLGGRLLNSRFLVHVGLISYSLYLWQQLFLTDLLRSRIANFPMNVIAAFAAAELSWRLVERPALRLRRRVSAWQLTQESAVKAVALLPTDSAEIAS
jgi:peptidoglycan/LPS O-acetylase OafA/YrhL